MELWNFRGNKELIIIQFLIFKNNDILGVITECMYPDRINEMTTGVSTTGKMLFNSLDCFLQVQKVSMRKHQLLVRSFSTVKSFMGKKS